MASFEIDDLVQKFSRLQRYFRVRSRLASKELIAQTGERCAIIDIEARLQFVNGHANLDRSSFRLFEDVLGAPIDLLEEASVNFLQSNQIITAIIGRPEHDPISWIRELYSGFGETGR